ncbi:hypothetical protein [Microbacterium sp. ZW T5_56]|uniref:hypothetical protein n=1 Tax=Microbacterium sp. ZW T5_56 TaxID=3378081 RepID=UPI003854760B
MLSDDDARELRELQRRVFRRGDVLGTTELGRLDELTRRAEESAAPAQVVPPDATARAEDLRDLLGGIGEESEVPAVRSAPSRRRGRIVVAAVGVFALFAALAAAFFVGRATVPTAPEALQQVVETGEKIAATHGWVTWNYAGSLNGIDYFAGVPESGERCVLPVSISVMPRPTDPLCTPPKTTDMVLQTDVHTAEGGAQTEFTTSVAWNSDSIARLTASAQPTAESLGSALTFAALGELAEDRARVFGITEWDAPPTLLDFSLTAGVSDARAVSFSYWAGTAQGARAVVVATAENTIISYLDNQQDPQGGPRESSVDLDPRLMLPDAPVDDTQPTWFWRVEWPVDGTPTLVPIWQE